MLHYSCDRCKRTLDAELDLRYVVEIDVRARMDGLKDDASDDLDPLQEIEDVLNDALLAGETPPAEDIARRLRFDLCPACYRRYLKNPLGREVPLEPSFSIN